MDTILSSIKSLFYEKGDSNNVDKENQNGKNKINKNIKKEKDECKGVINIFEEIIE